jgi:hypothetical protein
MPTAQPPAPPDKPAILIQSNILGSTISYKVSSSGISASVLFFGRRKKVDRAPWP